MGEETLDIAKSQRQWVLNGWRLGLRKLRLTQSRSGFGWSLNPNHLETVRVQRASPIG